MKISKVILTSMFFAIIFGLSTGNALANSFRSEKDSIDCLQKLSVASLAIEKNMHIHAVGPWRSLVEDCPDISVRIYSDGVKLWEQFIENAKEESTRQAYVDTLLMVYDKRLKYFGEYQKYPEGWILGRKGMEIIKYRRNNLHSLKSAYDCFAKSYSLRKEKSEPAVLLAWMQSSKILSDEGIVSDSSFISDYVSVYGEVQKWQLQEQYNSNIVHKVQQVLTSIIQRANFENCDVFSEVLGGAELVADLTSSEINTYLEVMKISGCVETELFTSLVLKKYEMNPSPEAAFDLARMFIRKRRFNKSADFYKEAASKTTDDSLKAVCYFELAVLTDGHFKKPVEARQYAKRSSLLMPQWGQPHLLLGSIYAREANNVSGNDFEKNAVYWVAVDQFLTAIRKDNSCKVEALKQIDVYTQYFPDKQTCFFYGLDEGQEFVVGDWINEPTTVRYR
ncbi:hypothetical protein [Marinilabilia sp.]|uniref:tetratricopeptide repeat protein n=1 Tax=Marinilabilia sp. TaxID=2021252 RepID=UPI0025BD7F1D|nr:hypothetical protein [Marinilabilia sp.]